MKVSDILKAKHIGVRAFRGNASKHINENKIIILTLHGKPKQVMVPYVEMRDLMIELSRLKSPTDAKDKTGGA